jgi:dienelactone hydrolase
MTSTQARHLAYDSDGEHMVGWLVAPEGGGRRPAVLVAHEAPGLTEHAKDSARRLAALGYVGFAVDYHGAGQPCPEAEARRRLGLWFSDPGGIRLRMAAALEALCAQPEADAGRIAGIGYCYGGAALLELARTGSELQAVIGFHSGLVTGRAAESVNIKGTVLVYLGADDPLVPPEHRQGFQRDMSAAGVDWRMILHGGVGHSFTNPEADARGIEGMAYNALADRRSWRAMLDLLGETIGAP